MKKLIMIFMLILSVGIYSEEITNKEVTATETTATETPVPPEPIVQPSDIYDDRDIEALKIKEYSNVQIDKKFTALETKALLDGEKIIKLESSLQEREQQITKLENEVEILIRRLVILEEKSEKPDVNPFENISEDIYRLGLLIGSILLGITIILIGMTMVQASKNKKIIEEWKEFFELNMERITKESEQKKENRENRENKKIKEIPRKTELQKSAENSINMDVPRDIGNIEIARNLEMLRNMENTEELEIVRNIEPREKK